MEKLSKKFLDKYDCTHIQCQLNSDELIIDFSKSEIRALSGKELTEIVSIWCGDVSGIELCSISAIDDKVSIKGQACLLYYCLLAISEYQYIIIV